MPAFFHNRLLMLVLMLGMGLGIVSSVYAEVLPASAEAVEKLQDRVIELEKETAVLKAELGTRIDAQDKLISVGIGEFGAQVTELSNQTSMLGGLIALVTILVAFAGYFSFSQATKNAVAAAKNEAIEESGKWFRENEKKLTERISALGQQVEDVEKHAAETKLRIEQAGRDVDDHAAETHIRIEQAEVSMAKGEKPSAEVVQQVAQDALDLNAKPRAAWTADDFYNAGVYSYTSGDYEMALTRWDTVINMLKDSSEPALSEQLAKTLFNKGVTLGQLNRSRKAIEAYGEVIRRFGDSPELALREQVAKAFFNKGATFGRLNQSQEELEAYDEVIRRFGESPELALRERVAMAMFSKGLSHGKHFHYKDALDAFEELISRFESSLEHVLRAWVARAMLLKGSTLDLETPDEAQVVFRDIISRFGESTEPEIHETVDKARRKLDGKS